MANWPLTGRDEEMAVLAGLFGDEPRKAGAVIAGAAGVGKTRLAREAVAAAAERGWVVRSVQGTAAAQAIPLGACAQWIDHRDDRPLNLVNSVIAAITESPDGAPVLVVADEVHLLDDLSAFVLHQLVRREAATVIATLRTGEPTSRSLNELWIDGHLQRIDLTALSDNEVDVLLENALEGPVDDLSSARLSELTRGNLLFLRELVRQELRAERLIRAGDDQWTWTGPITVSPSLADSVGAYIAAAPEPVLEVLDLLAVAEPLDLDIVSALADADAIEAAERLELIRVSHESPIDVVRLANPLYGEVRRARLGYMRARRLRGRLARAMRSPNPGTAPADPVRLALLWLESELPGDPEIHHLGAAAAFRRLDVPLSARLSEAAIRAGAGAESRVLRARALSMLGQADQAEAQLTESPTATTDAMWAEATTLRALNLLLAKGEPEQSWAVIEQSLAESPAEMRPELLAMRVLQLAMAARPSEAVELSESITPDQLTPRSRVDLNFGVTLALGERGLIERATGSPEDDFVLAAGSPVAAFQAVALALMHTEALVLGGYLVEALAGADRLGRQLVDLPEDPHTIAEGIRGVASLALGDLPAALGLLGAALATVELRDDVGNSASAYFGFGCWLRIALAEALARAGRADAAVDVLTEMQRCRHRSFIFLESPGLLAAAWVSAARGHISGALEFVGQATEFARGHGQYAREVLCLQTALQFGDTQDHAGRLNELAGLVEGPRAPVVARWAAALAGRDGDALLAVSADLESIGDRIAAADAAAHAAEVFGAKNLRGSKLTASTRATQLVTDCGATTPATREVAEPLPLSTREREIATLVRDGLSNKEIAQALTMSVRTVEGHIYRACGKLGLANRAALAEVIR